MQIFSATCTIGVLSRENLELIIKAYPEVIEKIVFANDYIYDRSYIAFNGFLESRGTPQDLTSCVNALEEVLQNIYIYIYI